MNERLKPEDSEGELINSLSGSHMFSLVMRLSRDERATKSDKK